MMTRLLTGLASATLLLLASCDAPTTARPDAAYNPTALSGGVLYRWSKGTTIRVWVAGADILTTLDLGLATRRAMAEWNRVPRFGEFRLELADQAADANVIVFERATVSPVRVGSCAFDPRGAAGYTYFCPGTDGRAERLGLTTGGVGVASVVIWVDQDRASSQRAYEAVVAHEFGHALGIGAHSDISGDLMFGLPAIASPSARDRATLRHVLGRVADLTL